MEDCKDFAEHGLLDASGGHSLGRLAQVGPQESTEGIHISLFFQARLLE
jgi:hypothetical protein